VAITQLLDTNHFDLDFSMRDVANDLLDVIAAELFDDCGSRMPL